MFLVQVTSEPENIGDIWTDVTILWLISVCFWQARRRSPKQFPQAGAPSLYVRTVRDGWEDHLQSKTGESDPGTWAAASPDLNSHSFFPGIKAKVHSGKIRDTNPPRWGITDAGVVIDGRAVLMTVLLPLGTKHWVELSAVHRGQCIQLVMSPNTLADVLSTYYSLCTFSWVSRIYGDPEE